jgi:hypothetical protein
VPVAAGALGATGNTARLCRNAQTAHRLAARRPCGEGGGQAEANGEKPHRCEHDRTPRESQEPSQGVGRRWLVALAKTPHSTCRSDRGGATVRYTARKLSASLERNAVESAYKVKATVLSAPGRDVCGRMPQTRA